MSVPLRPHASELRYAWLGDRYVDFTAHRLHSDGRETRLTPKACAVLRELAMRENLVVRRDDLLGLVWRDGFPTDDVLTQAIRELRRALGDDTRSPVLIETIPRVGYRLRASVRVVPTPPAYHGMPQSAAANDGAEGRADPGLDVAPLPCVIGASTPAPASAPDLGDFDPAALLDPSRAHHAASAHRRPALLLLAVVVLVVGVIAVSSQRVRGPAEAAAAPRAAAHVAPPVALTSDPGTEYFPAVSPDGNLIAFVATEPGVIESSLKLKGRDPAAAALTLVPVVAGYFMAHPVWSPDGDRILYGYIGDGSCEIRVVAASGGAARRVTGCNAGMMDGFDWSPDGSAIYMSVPKPEVHPSARVLARIELDTGTITPLSYGPRADDDVDLYPRVSPDGQWLAFRRGVRPYADVWLMPLAGGQARPLARLGSRQRGMAWTSDSAGVVVSSDHAGLQGLYRVAIADGSVRSLGIDRAEFPSVSRRSDVVAYNQIAELTQLAVFPIGPGGDIGQGRLVAPASRSDYAMELSPSGQRIAFVSERSGSPQVWLHDFVSGQTSMLSDEANATPDFPQWSPDDGSLLYIVRGQGSSRLIEIELATRRRAVRSLAQERVRFGSYSPDDRSILFSSDRSGQWQVWRMDRDGSGAQQLTQTGGLDARQFPGDPHVYYTKLSFTGMFRLDLASGEEEKVTNALSFLYRGAFTVQGGELWLFNRTSAKQGELLVRPVNGGPGLDDAIRTVSPVIYAGGYPLPVASFDRQRKLLAANLVMREGTDLFVARLPP